MVFTSRVEVLGVTYAFRFSFITNKVHNDLFSKGVFDLRKKLFYLCDKYIPSTPNWVPKNTLRKPGSSPWEVECATCGTDRFMDM